MIEQKNGEEKYKRKYERALKLLERTKTQFKHSETIRENQQQLIELQATKIKKLKSELREEKQKNEMREIDLRHQDQTHQFLYQSREVCPEPEYQLTPQHTDFSKRRQFQDKHSATITHQNSAQPTDRSCSAKRKPLSKKTKKRHNKL